MKKYFIFYENQLLLKYKNNELSLPETLKFDVTIGNSYDIGVFNKKCCEAIEITAIDINENYQLFPLKSALEKIGQDWFAAATRAYQIIQWDRNHKFCGKCGEKTTQIDHLFEKICAHCHLSFFPKLSPAIIVLIKKDNQILMARQKSFPEGVYGLIAGFVEAGETLEEAIHREVLEEVGICIKNIRYFGSQPWPFPDSLMLAFIADYESGEISCQDGELEIAGWYDVKNLPGYPSSSTSIAIKMIYAFLEQA